MSTTAVMTTLGQLIKFIDENDLDFPSGGRNANLVALIGYGLYIGADVQDCKTAIPEGELTEDVAKELERLYTYCESRNYSKWWENESNRNTYNL